MSRQGAPEGSPREQTGLDVIVTWIEGSDELFELAER
jgi:hypothetical protein